MVSTGHSRKRLRRKSAGLQVAAGTSSSGLAVLLALRGLEIQYPFSQMILAKLKDTEVRHYALGHHNIANPDEEMFMIETPPKNQASAEVDHIDLGPPPRRAQVVGTVSFSRSVQYKDQTAWNRDRRRHCIKQGSRLDWHEGQRQEKHAWRIREVRRFPEPVPVSDHAVASLSDMASALRAARIGDPLPDPSHLSRVARLMPLVVPRRGHGLPLSPKKESDCRQRRVNLEGFHLRWVL